jgi:hypothetical protein
LLAFLNFVFPELRKYIGLGITPEQAYNAKFGLAKEVLAEIPGQLCHHMRVRAMQGQFQ